MKMNHNGRASFNVICSRHYGDGNFSLFDTLNNALPLLPIKQPKKTRPAKYMPMLRNIIHPGPLGDGAVIITWKHIYELIYWNIYNCCQVDYKTPLMTSQHWSRCLGAIKQQVITWANVDPDVCNFVVVWYYSILPIHYNDVIMGAMASQITSLTIVYSAVYSGADQRKHKSSGSLAFVRGIHRWHKWPVARKMFPFDDVITIQQYYFTSTETIVNWGHHAIP